MQSSAAIRYNPITMSDPAVNPADPRDARIAELETQVRELTRLLGEERAARAALEAQLAARPAIPPRQATPFARRQRKAQPHKPGRKPGQGTFKSLLKKSSFEAGSVPGAPVRNRLFQQALILSGLAQLG